MQVGDADSPPPGLRHERHLGEGPKLQSPPLPRRLALFGSRRRQRWSVLLCVVGLTSGLVGSDWASAASPVGRAQYVAAPYLWDIRVELRVSKNSRRLVPSDSRIDVPDECGGVSFQVGSRARRVRIARDGRFVFRHRGPRAIRLGGRFITPDRARVTISYSPDLSRSVPLSCGARERSGFLLERVRRFTLRDCRTHREESKLDAETGRVFNGYYYGRGGWDDVAWACLFADNRRVLLGRRRYDTDDAGFGPFKLVGELVAMREFECFATSCPDWWKVIDLQSGATIRQLPRDLGVPDLNRVYALELREDGAVAMIVGSTWGPRGPEVWTYGSQGPRQLDVGNIAPESLQLDGSIVRWVKDGAPRSAVLE